MLKENNMGNFAFIKALFENAWVGGGVKPMSKNVRYKVEGPVSPSACQARGWSGGLWPE